MISIKQFIILLSLIIIMGCSGTFNRISNIKVPTQQTVYDGGRETIISTKINTVTITHENQKIESDTVGTKINFIVCIKNGGEQDIVFSTENITAFLQKNNSNKLIKVYNADEMEEQYFVESTRLYAISKRKYSISSISRQGIQGFFIGDEMKTHDENDDNYEDYENDYENEHFVTIFPIKKQTVPSGKWYGGMITIQIPKAFQEKNSFIIQVNFNNEIHSFSFNQQRIKTSYSIN